MYLENRDGRWCGGLQVQKEGKSLKLQKPVSHTQEAEAVDLHLHL